MVVVEVEGHILQAEDILAGVEVCILAEEEVCILVVGVARMLVVGEARMLVEVGGCILEACNHRPRKYDEIVSKALNKNNLFVLFI
jgi:hypothetical protein